MKLAIALLAISISAQAEPPKNIDGAKIDFYQMTPTVRVAVTNLFCEIEPVRRTHPWVAYQFYIEQGQYDMSKVEAFDTGCFGPKDMKFNDISFVWENSIPFDLPANAFLLPQNLYDQEVPKIPQIKDDGTRIDI